MLSTFNLYIKYKVIIYIQVFICDLSTGWIKADSLSPGNHRERVIAHITCLLSLQGILDRLNAHKRDLEALSRAAQEMGEVDEEGCAMKEIQELIERFESLQKNISEKREFFQRVAGKWHKFAEQKHKMNAFFKNTHGIVTKRQVKNADDCKKQIEECQVIRN